MDRGNDGAVRKRELRVSKGLDRNVIAQLGAHLFDASRQVVDGNQAPVTVIRGDFDSVDWRGISVRLSGCGDRGAGGGRQCSNHNQRENNPLHRVPLCLDLNGYTLVADDKRNEQSLGSATLATPLP